MLVSNNTQGPVIILSRDVGFAIPFGIAYLAGYLKQKGEDYKVLFWPDNSIFLEKFVEDIIKEKPLLVGFGGLYPDLNVVSEIIKIFRKKNVDFPLIVGGQMVSPTPEFSISITGADYGVVGEGEIILYNMVKRLRAGLDSVELGGVACFVDDKYVFGGPGEYIEDLSLLPEIPYEIFPNKRWLEIGKYYARIPQIHWRYSDRVVSIHGGRGCPYKCNFCYHHSKARYRKVADMMKEADKLIQKYDANMLYFGDDLVLCSPKRATELVESIPKLSRSVEYSVSCRFDILSRIDDDLLLKMKKTGCRIMGLGIESGSDKILKTMNKGITVAQVREGLSRLNKVGILPTVSIMVGQDGETAEDFALSMKLMEDLVLQNRKLQFAFTITTPFPGSPLYCKAKEKGLISGDRDFFDRFNDKKQLLDLSLNMSEMSDEQVLKARNQLEKRYLNLCYEHKGKLVFVIEKLRRFLVGFQIICSIFHKLLSFILPERILNIASKPFVHVYDWLQLSLEKIIFWKIRFK